MLLFLLVPILAWAGICVLGEQKVESVEFRDEEGAIIDSVFLYASNVAEETTTSMQIRAFGKLNDGGYEDITDQVVWLSSDETKLQVEKGFLQVLGFDNAEKNIEVRITYKNSDNSEIKGLLKTLLNHSNPEEEGKKACELIGGKEGAEFNFILTRTNKIAYGSNPGKCIPIPWSSEDNYEDFKAITSLEADVAMMNLTSIGRADKVGIYVFDGILEDNSESISGVGCPFSVESFGFVLNCPDESAAYINAVGGGAAVYASGGFGDSEENYTAITHEQIGHGLGALDDEYVYPEGKDYLRCGDLISNCTTEVACSRFNNISGLEDMSCIEGCIRGDGFWRTKNNSVMREHWLDSKFSPLQREMIKYRIDNYPNKLSTEIINKQPICPIPR